MKSWIYFAQHGVDGPIKVGRTADPRRRVMDLSVGSPVPLVLLGALLSNRAETEEAEIHERLRSHCIRGEWFAAVEARHEMTRLNLRMRSPDELRRLATANDTFSVGINFRAPHEELAAWKQAARDAGMSFSQWARSKLDMAAQALLGEQL